jgi:hypothetical protein
MYSLSKQEQPVAQKAPKSKRFLQLKNLSNWTFRAICFAGGALATNAVRHFTAYLWFYAIMIVLAVVFLLTFSPADTEAKYLWRGGLIPLVGGLVAPWWELFAFVPLWVWGATILGVGVILVAIGGAS